MDLRKKITNWSEITFKEQKFEELNFSKDQTDKIFNEFAKLKILEVSMDGYCTESLPKTSETGAGLNYSKIFHSTLQNEYFSPAMFLAKYIIEYEKSSLDKKKLTGFLARGLRTFASLIREQDFAVKIKDHLQSADKNIKVNMDPEQDTKSHVDIRLNFKGQIYNLWTYQASKNAIYPHTIERVTGQRGELENGLHLLCPINTELGQTLLKKRKSLIYKTTMLKKWEAEFLKIDKPTKKKETLDKKIPIKKNEILELKKDIKQLEIDTKNLSIVEGWFLYSNEYISEIAKKITNLKNESIVEYNSLKEKLLLAEKTLKSLVFFKK